MNATPTSTRTIYFDAPLVHFTEKPFQMTGKLDQPPSHDSMGWLPAVDPPAESSAQPPARHSSVLRRNSPTRPQSAMPHNVGTDTTDETGNAKSHNSVRRDGSISRRSVFTNVDVCPASPFVRGAGSIATADPNEELATRAASADTALTPSQRSRINKLEAKKAKRLSKIIRAEGKVEKKALDVAIDELAGLQSLQKKVVKDEAKAYTFHAKLLDTVRKYEVECLDAKARYEALLARLFAEEQVLEKIKEHAREATEHMRAKAEEVDHLRTMFGVDERERELRVMQLTEKKSLPSIWR